MVAEDRGAARLGVLDGARQVAGKAVAVEDVVAQHQAHGSPAMNSSPMVKACARPSGLGLLGVGQVHAVARAVPEQALEVGQVGRGWR